MFTQSTENRIIIKNFSFRIVLEMLRFIYVEKVENLEVVAADLLIAADKVTLE
jgi:hypothetical protein